VTTAVATPDWPRAAHAEKPRQAAEVDDEKQLLRDSPQKAMDEELMEQIVSLENATAAWKAVKRNHGAPGIDGMTVEQLRDHVREHWGTIRTKLLAGTYLPTAVKRVEILKPDGGIRLLGVPTVQDRWIQQMLLQVLQGIFDPTFSEHS
jgi:RNA-directed DNA polymerase